MLQDLGERSATSDLDLEGDSVNANVHRIIEGEAEGGLGVEEDDRGLHIPRLVAELFQRVDTNRAMSQSRSNNEGDANEPMTADGVGPTQDSGGFGDDVDMGELIRESKTPLYDGSPMNRLGTILVLLNLCSVYGVSNNFIDELFGLLKNELLPKVNTLPKTRYEATKIMKKLGLAYDAIHACEAGCVLFRKELVDETHCPKCNLSRYVDGSSTIPRKVLRHFPIIPRLKRMFHCSNIAQLMQWHFANRSTDGMVRSVFDSKAWKHIDDTWTEFAAEPRHVRLGLALDGMNPFADLLTRHSTWPVMTLNYNLPPWLVTKKFFVMLSLIIPGVTPLP